MEQPIRSVAVMQPYFFPYLGYYALIKHTDAFVILDTVQYIQRGWINRNRVLKPNEGWEYITAPVQKHSSSTPIGEVQLAVGKEWREKIIRYLDHYRKRAPYYAEVRALLEDCFASTEPSISRFNAECLGKVCAYLGLEFNCLFHSELPIDPGTVTAADEWSLRTSQYLGATEYINPPGGRSFFDHAKYDAGGVDLKFLSINLTPYDQKRPVFEPGLSMVDVMMFNDPATIRTMLDDVVIER